MLVRTWRKVLGTLPCHRRKFMRKYLRNISKQMKCECSWSDFSTVPSVTSWVCCFCLDLHVVFIQYECWETVKMSWFAYLQSSVTQSARGVRLKCRYSFFRTIRFYFNLDSLHNFQNTCTIVYRKKAHSNINTKTKMTNGSILCVVGFYLAFLFAVCVTLGLWSDCDIDVFSCISKKYVGNEHVPLIHL